MQKTLSYITSKQSLKTTNSRYPFGMQIQKRSYSATSYRFAFNGMERDDEISGKDNAYDFGARIYDSRLGRWMSVDPLQKNFPDLSTYNFVANSPIIYLDPDGKDIVYFNSSGNETRRTKSETVFKTFVVTSYKIKQIIDENGTIHISKILTYTEAEMPNRIKTMSQYEVNKGFDRNQFDHIIAVEVFLFNKKLEKNKALEKTPGAGHPIVGTVPKLDPNLIKAMVLQESNGGTGSAKKDIMQVNNSGDWAPTKTRVGLSKGVTPDPQSSIRAGIQWLYYKGVNVSEVEYEQGTGKIIGGKVTWNGGADWSNAAMDYNTKGNTSYLADVLYRKGLLKFGLTVDGFHLPSKKKALKKVSPLKKKKSNKTQSSNEDK